MAVAQQFVGGAQEFALASGGKPGAAVDEAGGLVCVWSSRQVVPDLRRIE